MTKGEAATKILGWISRTRPAYARTLAWEMARMDEDGHLDRVMQALGAIFPPDLNGTQRTTAAARPGSPGGEVTAAKPGEPVAVQQVGLSAHDRSLFDEFEAALKRFEENTADYNAFMTRGTK